jgi:hypothetical protein
MLTLNGRLTSSQPADFVRFGVTVLFQRLIPPRGENEEPLATAASVTARPAEDGKFAADLGETAEVLGPFSLAVTSEAGTVVAVRQLDSVEGVVKIEVQPLEPFSMPEDRDPTEGVVVKLLGRVLTTAGEAAETGLPVVLWGSSAESQAPRPLITAATSTGGYFSARWPPDRLVRAFATVAARDAGVIPLEDDRLPLRVVLVVDLPETASPDAEPCACEQAPRTPDQEDLVNNPEAFSTDLGGKCIDFTAPNRVLEEFPFYAVVRTTQPEVKGTTAEPPRALPPFVVQQLIAVADKADRFRALTEASRGALIAVADKADRSRALTEIGRGDETHAVDPCMRGSTLTMSAAAGAGPARPTAGATSTGAPPLSSDAKLHPQILSEMLKGPSLFTSEKLVAAERISRFENVSNLVRGSLPAAPARAPVSLTNPIDWDDTPTIYQATSVAHGHILTLKQVWRADGYSLGDLLYSLPLAPCQKKEIAVIDWDRRAVTARLESRTATESLQAGISRDRDISEIISTNLTESVRAGSSAKTWAAGGGFGAFIGPLVIGGGGGASGASSTAWQNSARQIAASSLQQVRDRTLQAASATRNQRSTIVQTVRQGETMRVQTEVVANHNHCHAVTMEYFEILRHFQVSQELAAVQECLFVPMAVGHFNGDKALRWREPLMAGLQKPELAGAFDSLERVQTNWANADYPLARYADEAIRNLDGELQVSFELPRPADTDPLKLFDAAQWVPYHGLLTPLDSGETQPQAAQRIWNTFLGLEKPENRDAVWNAQLAPRIAQRLVNQFRFELVLDDNSSVPLPMDATLASRFRQGRPLLVSIRPVNTTPNVIRARIRTFRISTAANLPVAGRVLVHSATARYRTDHLSRDLFQDFQVMNDLSSLDRVDIPIRLDAYEKSNPRARDRDLASRLLDHLNSNVEHYLQTTWMLTDPNRLYILLDSVPAPGANGKSVASVVENRVLGVVGNCLVLPVAPGYHLDPTFKESDKATLFDVYRPNTPLPPMRISVPTRGVFAEAVMGACNSCEPKDEMRFWRWDEAPCPDEPPRIQDVSTETRATAEPSLTPTAFPTAIVRIQNAPDLPAPASLAAAMRLIGTPNLFRDITGLDLNQQNAAQAFQSALDTAQFFGGRAADLAQQRFLNTDMDRTIKAISDAKQKGLIDDAAAQRLTSQALLGSVGDRQAEQSRPTSNPAVQRFIDRASSSTSSELNVSRPEGSVTVKSGDTDQRVDRQVKPDVPFIPQTSALTCWAAAAGMMYGWRHGELAPLSDLIARIGPTWQAMFEGKESIPNSQVPALMEDLGLVAEAPASYLPRGIERLLETGPLWVVADEDLTDNDMTHAEVVTGIVGDGTVEGTKVLINDPSGSKPRSVGFQDFQSRLEAPDVVKSGLGIYHFPRR